MNFRLSESQSDPGLPEFLLRLNDFVAHCWLECRAAVFAAAC
jgi:hypothetical protein